MQNASERGRATITTVGGEKGGTGKTTMAINLAVCRARAGRDVILVDTDSQGSSSDWIQFRNQRERRPAIASVQKFGTDLPTTLRDLSLRYQDIIVDAGGRDSPELRAAMTVTDVLLVPLQASSFDLWTLTRLDELTNLVMTVNPGILVKVMLNRGSTNPSVKDSERAQELFSEFQLLQPITTEVHDRIVYRHAAREGAGVIEMDDEKARAEVRSLYREIYGEDWVEAGNE